MAMLAIDEAQLRGSAWVREFAWTRRIALLDALICSGHAIVALIVRDRLTFRRFIGSVQRAQAV